MENFTYEDKKPAEQVLETYEWDNIWWEHASDTTQKRALIIGDSISCGYRGRVNALLAGEIYVDGFGSSKAVDNPYFERSLALCVEQSGCSLMLFNNGLHGWHLSAEEYETHYRELVKALVERYPDKKLVLMLTTPMRKNGNLSEPDEERNRLIGARNAAARRVAKEFHLDVLDLYEVLADKDGSLWMDPCHLCADGYEMLAKLVTDCIRENI